jgi:hypothetical protein
MSATRSEKARQKSKRSAPTLMWAQRPSISAYVTAGTVPPSVGDFQDRVGVQPQVVVAEGDFDLVMLGDAALDEREQRFVQAEAGEDGVALGYRHRGQYDVAVGHWWFPSMMRRGSATS